MGRVTINGQTFDVEGDVSITSRNGNVTIKSGGNVVTQVGDLGGKVATIKLEGVVARDVTSDGDISVDGDVKGNVKAGENVDCKNVGGNVDAGENVTCSGVAGDVEAGENITCGNVGGDAEAGENMTRR